jgi:DNA-binding CsgD family transcriptional regulator
MGKSQRPSLHELRDIYLLVGECCEVGADPLAWCRRMHDGLADVLKLQVGVYMMGPAPAFMREPDPSDVAMAWGWPSASSERLYLEYLSTKQMTRDPAAARMAQIRSPWVTRRRCEVLDDRDWYRSVAFNEWHRRSGVDDHLMSVGPVGPERILLLSLWRTVGDRRFQAREATLARLFHREIALLLGRKLAPFSRGPAEGLPPRVRQVLALLVEGLSEKQVARELAISPHTVHDYTKRLHQHFRVASRGELLACCRHLALVLPTVPSQSLIVPPPGQVLFTSPIGPAREGRA